MLAALMFDRFSDHSKKAMTAARDEALRLRHPAIAPEHVLLALLANEHGEAAAALQRLGVDQATLRSTLQSVLQQGGAAIAENTQLPFTPGCKQVLEAALAAAAELGHTHLSTLHLLVGLVSVGDEMPAQILTRLGVDRAAVLREAAEAVQRAERDRVRLLLISNSTMHGGGYLEHCAAEIRDFLGARRKVLFVPYALHDHAAYAERARSAFAALGHELTSVHEHNHSPAAVADADAVFIGGGNTFRLLAALYHYSLLPAIQQRALAGMPYIGSSAGTNVATLSIRTTNDMPIVQPPTFTALQLVPFQINPHYLDPDPTSKHMGETREERLRQFHEEHATPVLGLREGCMVRVEGKRARLLGTTNARLFRRGLPPEEMVPPCDVSHLLRE